jgi:hypothetical protein
MLLSENHLQNIFIHAEAGHALALTMSGAPMLFHLAGGVADAEFLEMMHAIMNSLWPKVQFQTKAHIHMLPAWENPPDADKRLQEIRQKLWEITCNISRDGDLYTVYRCDPTSKEIAVAEHRGLPFADRYHRYFLLRQWEYPHRDPRANWENLFRLLKDPTLLDQGAPNELTLFQNYSRNWGDYHHFLNVVAATARLIEYFGDERHTLATLRRRDADPPEAVELRQKRVAEQLSYHSHYPLRLFKLMLAAYYHDLGKTVENHRHGMEGASILANHTTEATAQLNQIFQNYASLSKHPTTFDRDDLLQITHLVYYHDQFGMLATGEAGYARLVDLVHRIRRSTVTHNLETQRGWSRRCLFDLWVLNLADIMVSLDGLKYVLQMDLWERESAQKRIHGFLAGPKVDLLRHDFCLALKLLESQNESRHGDDLAPMEQQAQEYAKRHAVERIRRLLLVLLVDVRSVYLKDLEFGPESPALAILDKISEFSEAKWNSTLARCIYALGDYGEFVQRFCWIGQMDYAFGFFNKIARRALWLVNREILGQAGLQTGWVYQPLEGYVGRGGRDQWRIEINADFFADNLASTLVQILHHILFKEREISRLRNLEFWVASQRLTDEKIDRIIALEGPFRTRSSVQLALESIFIW